MAADGNMSPQQLAEREAALNEQAKRMILAPNGALDMLQQIYSASYAPATQSVIPISVRPVGLVKGFFIEVNGVLNNASGTANRTEFGASNALSNIQFFDLNNYLRVNVPGWYLAMLDTAKNGFGFGGAYAPNLPMGYGNNWTVQSLAASWGVTTAALRQIYYLPLAYGPQDLRGSMYAGVVNATAQLQLTLNTSPGYTAAADSTLAIAGGAGSNVTWSGSVTYTVYQSYLDQLPRDSAGGAIYPVLDTSIIYDLKCTTFTGLTAASDFPIDYSNFRTFLSTMAVYDNAGVLGVGADLNYLALQLANTTQIMKVTPQISALLSRQAIMSDWPKGVYYFDHRNRPVNTLNYGNAQLVLNPSAVSAGARVFVGWEAMMRQDAAQGASSLAAAG